MRYARLGLLAAGLIVAAAACHTSIPSAPGVDAKAAAHFDSLVTQANAANQPKRAAALQIALRSIADGGNASAHFLASTGAAFNTPLTLGTITWSYATVKLLQSGVDSVTDSLLVQVSWSGANADTIIVTRVGDAMHLATPIAPQLSVLGLTTPDTSKGVFIDPTDNAVVSDSGKMAASFAVLGTPCTYTTVQNSGNDSQTPGTCDRVGAFWQFALRFPPSVHFGVANGGSPGIVVVK